MGVFGLIGVGVAGAILAAFASPWLGLVAISESEVGVVPDMAISGGSLALATLGIGVVGCADAKPMADWRESAPRN